MKMFNIQFGLCLKNMNNIFDELLQCYYIENHIQINALKRFKLSMENENV